jgi:inositol 1,4,5-triphosphate receptor type 1
MRRVDSRKHSNPSTSANTYWQIEKEEDSKSGDVISWGERVRFKHLPTRRYLAVIRHDEKYMVILKERSVDDNDLDTIFSLSPLIEEGESVALESYAHIKHLYSKQWLHLETKNVYTKKNFNSEAKGLAGLQWDSAELFMLTTSEDKGDYDSFTLQEVTEDLIDRFNYVAGIVPVLEACNKIIHSGSDIRGKQAIRIRDTLIELREWIVTDDERDTKNNQKLLRNLRV